MIDNKAIGRGKLNTVDINVELKSLIIICSSYY